MNGMDVMAVLQIVLNWSHEACMDRLRIEIICICSKNPGIATPDEIWSPLCAIAKLRTVLEQVKVSIAEVDSYRLNMPGSGSEPEDQNLDEFLSWALPMLEDE